MKRSLWLVVTAVLVTVSVASAQNQSSQDAKSAPTELQNSTPNKLAIDVPEAATDTPGVPSAQTSGQGPNVSKKMVSAGDQKAAPDGE
jgi:hypothetical protein